MQGSLKGPPSLAPLEVNTSHGNNNAAMDPRREPLISSKSGKIMANIVKEMSQLDSPELRELAYKMGNMLNIESPKYQSEGSYHPSHLKINIANRWQVLQGCNFWRGLLDPLDNAMRAEIIRYGEFAQATYDAFDKRISLNCKYEMESLLESVGLANRGYEVTDLIYASTDLHLANVLSFSRNGSSSSSRGSSVEDHAQRTSRQSNWIGFVAVCTSAEEIHRLGRRDIAIAWRGTCTPNEFLADIKDYMSPIRFGPGDDCSLVRVMAGFLDVYTSTNLASEHNKTSSARDQVMGAVKILVAKYKHDGKLSITLTGHSLGSALATLCAYDIAEHRYNLPDSPSTPQRWSAENSPATPGAKSHEESHLPHSHLGSVKHFVHSTVHLKEKEEENVHEDILVKHPHTAAVRNFLHTNLHHSEDSPGHRVIKDVKNLVGREVTEFPKGKIPITVYSFAGPRVGNRVFKNRLHELGVAVLRVVNVHDVVPAIPGLKHFRAVAEKLHKIIPHLPSYKHVGVKLEVDNTKSLFLRSPLHIWEAHCLEAYLHLVDVYRAKHHYAGAHDTTFRDYALVNRTSNLLKAEYYIPPHWKESNEVARDHNGHWLFPGRVDWTAPQASNVDQQYADFWGKVDEATARSRPAQPAHCL